MPRPKGPDDEVLSGSFVTAGRGWYRADGVGPASYANQIAAEARRFSLVRSELRRGTDRILGLVTWAIVPTATLLIVSQLQANRSLPGAVRGSVAGVVGVVGMVPEGLVLLTSIAFTAGVLRLGRRGVLVQELAASEARGDVVCMDKAGTITEPDLEVAEVVPLGAERAPGAATGATGTAAARGRGGPPSSWTSSRAAAAGCCWPVPADRRAPDAPPPGEPAALVAIEERVRPNARETLDHCAAQGVTVKVMSGDDPRTSGCCASPCRRARWRQWPRCRPTGWPAPRTCPRSRRAQRRR